MHLVEFTTILKAVKGQFSHMCPVIEEENEEKSVYIRSPMTCPIFFFFFFVVIVKIMYEESCIVINHVMFMYFTC